MTMTNIDIIKSYLESGCDILTTGLLLNDDYIQLRYDGCEPYSLKPTAFRLVECERQTLLNLVSAADDQRVMAAERSVIFITNNEALLFTDTFLPPPYNYGQILIYFNTSNDYSLNSRLKNSFDELSQMFGYTPVGLFGNTEKCNPAINSMQS